MHELVTIVAQYFIVLPLVGYAVVLFRVRVAARKQFIITSLVSAVLALLLIKLAASLYHDPRPFVRDGVTPYFGHSRDNGFPSDHATLSALLAWLVYGAWRKFGLVLGVIAILIGSARVIAGVHHTRDIIGGFCIAAISYGLAVLISKLVWHEKA